MRKLDNILNISILISVLSSQKKRRPFSMTPIVRMLIDPLLLCGGKEMEWGGRRALVALEWSGGRIL